MTARHVVLCNASDHRSPSIMPMPAVRPNGLKVYVNTSAAEGKWNSS